MKITAERVLSSVVKGPMSELTDAISYIIHKTASASTSKPVEIGRYSVTGSREGLGDDHVMAMAMLSLLFEEVRALRREVRALRREVKTVMNQKKGGE